MKSSVITFPGSNCDRDMDVALKKFGFNNKMVWHNDNELPKSDLVVLPGGFSYGDYLRCGSMASKSKIMQSVINFSLVCLSDITTFKRSINSKQFPSVK